MKAIRIVAHAVVRASNLQDPKFTEWFEDLVVGLGENCDQDLCLEQLEMLARETNSDPRIIEFLGTL
jgi:hypothetical protein